MDAFNRAAAQLRELLESMSPSARLLAGLLLAVVVISVGMVFQPGGQAPEDVLFGGGALSDNQLNGIELAIAQAGLSGHRREGRQIRVPAEQKAAYLAAVADADALPPNFDTMLERALDKGNPLESREATRERLKIAKQQTLSEIVRAMHWVEDAVVLYDEQEAHGLSGKKVVIGSVSVKPKAGESLDLRRARMLQTLVAHAVVGLRSDDVAVTNLGASETCSSESADYGETFGGADYQAQISYEQYKRQSILSALSDIPGVRVEVNAEAEDTIAPVAKNAPLAERPTIGEARTKSEQRPSGTFAQGPNRPLEGDEDSVDGACREPERNGFEPKQVWATVTIPYHYVKSIWQQRNTGISRPPMESELRIVQEEVVGKVESIVEPLLPRAANSVDAGKQVRVVVLESVVKTPIAPPTLSSQAWTWANDHKNTLALLGMAAVGLVVLQSVFPSAPSGKRQTKDSEIEVQSPLTAGADRSSQPEPLSMLRFDDLARLDDATLAAVIQEVEADIMALALTGANDELMERIMGQIPRQVAKTFRQQLLRLGPTRLRDVEAAQQAVAAVASRMLESTHSLQRAA